ncbi:MAG: nucleotidyltransferase domain-containing protein [Leptospirales bacterium]|nr:nucleotidyltransferase domain-containing protein [Leptospirales bacterium]
MAKIPSEIIELIDKFVKSVKEDNIEVYKVILYGSYAKGTYNQHSDIDLAIISPNFKEGECIKNVSRLLLKAAKLKADIQTMPFSIEEYQSPLGLMEEILNTGIEIFNTDQQMIL